MVDRLINTKKQEPLISIIVPVFNVEEFLDQCLETLINQTYRNLEILVINDGSTDRSEQIIRRYAELDQRIKFIDKKNSGYGDTCNQGILMCSGQFISIVEPDDYVSKQFVETLLKDALNSNADVVKGLFNEVYNGSIRKPKFPDIEKIPNKVFCIEENSLLLTYHPSIWSCLYKTSFIRDNKIEFQKNPGAGWADNLFQVKTLIKATKIYVNKQSFNYFYRLRCEDPSEDLRDPYLPYKRSLEIHNWLKENNINSKIVLSSLLIRELSYIKQILKMPRQKDESGVIAALGEFSAFVAQYDDIYRCYFPKDRKLLSNLIRDSSKIRKITIIKLKFKRLFKIHITKNERTIILFGIKIIREK